MPPGFTMNVSNSYLEELRAYRDEQHRLHELKQEAEADFASSIRPIKRPKPLDDQIAELMRTLPPKLRNRPWSMAELVQRLAGKYRARPHAQQVGEALRRLGWRRERLWNAEYDGVRVWLPN